MGAKRTNYGNFQLVTVIGCEVGLGAGPRMAYREPGRPIKGVLVHVLEGGELRIRHACSKGMTHMGVLAHPAGIGLSDRNDDLLTKRGGKPTPDPNCPQLTQPCRYPFQVPSELGNRIGAWGWMVLEVWHRELDLSG
ncbi:MAG: hypothetical protein OEM15_16615 [Myxococcales bacterium]|nr:hypothetical protein [Myxococcales bacterium]